MDARNPNMLSQGADWHFLLTACVCGKGRLQLIQTGVSLFLTVHRFLAFSGTTLSGMETACL